MRITTLMLAVLLVFSFGALFAADHPDFSGTWLQNADKSDTGGGRSRAASKLVVTQDAKKMTVERTSKNRDGEDFTRSEELPLDGKEVTVEGFRGRDRVMSATWSKDGQTLTIFSSMVFERNGEEFEMTSTSNWTLDGKTLMIDSVNMTPRGERESKLVYDKK